MILALLISIFIKKGGGELTEQELRMQVANNLAEYRRLYELTQAELAEKLNYSDKSVSKWERGDGMPDMYVLSRIAEIYDISVDDLISDRTPRKTSTSFKAQRHRKRVLITLLSVGLVWLVAVTAFFVLQVFVPELPRTWLAFVLALPPSAIVLTVFAGLWGRHVHQFCSVTGIVWSTALCLHLAFPIFQHMYLIYLVAAVLQVLIVLWFIFIRISRRRGGGE